MFFGSRQKMKSVAAAEAAALGAWRVISQGDRVGGIVFNDEEISVVPPGRSSAAVMRLLREICRLNGELGADTDAVSQPGMLDRALSRAAGLLGHDGLLAIVSDFAGTSADTPRIIGRVAAHNDIIAIPISDPLEAELPAVGPLAFEHGGDQVQVDTRSASLRRAFSERFAARTRRAEVELRRFNVPMLPISTDGDVVRQVQEQLGQARGRRTGIPRVTSSTGAVGGDTSR
jgi:uncharacterized protein (DUF58 family)